MRNFRQDEYNSAILSRFKHIKIQLAELRDSEIIGNFRISKTVLVRISNEALTKILTCIGEFCTKTSLIIGARQSTHKNRFFFNFFRSSRVPDEISIYAHISNGNLISYSDLKNFWDPPTQINVFFDISKTRAKILLTKNSNSA